MTEFIRKIVRNPKDDIFAGITVSLAMIPEVGGLCLCGTNRSIGCFVGGFYDWIDYRGFWR